MTRWEVTIDIPLAKPLASIANERLHWSAKARTVKAQRHSTALHLRAQGHAFLREWRVMSGNTNLRIACTLTRVAPRVLDGDNLQGAFKGVRDQVAEECALDDGSKRWDWHYAQERGRAAYRIRLEVLMHEVVR